MIGCPLTPDSTALFFGQTAPNAGVLICVESKIKAIASNSAVGTNPFGVGHGDKCLAGCADRKEEFRIGVATQCLISPYVIGGCERGRKD